MNFSVFAPYKGVTGYDFVVRAFLKPWYYQSHNIRLVEFEKWSLTRTTTPIDAIIQSMEKSQCDPEFHLNFSLLDQSQLNLNTPNYIYTMFEADKICPAWVESAKRLDGVIVPTQWSKKIFAASGIPEEKIIVSPVPLDINYIKNSALDINVQETNGVDLSKFKHRFLNVSEYISRKNIDRLIQAWCDEVKPEDNACLILKLNSNSGLKLDFLREKLSKIIKNKGSAPIFLFNSFVTEEAMLGFYKFCTHYISTSYGEGFGLSEAICGVLGKKVIAPDSTAFKDYLNKDNSYPIMTQAVGCNQEGPTKKYYVGARWFAPIQFSVRKNIRQSINDANNNITEKETRLSAELSTKFESNMVASELLLNLANIKGGKKAPTEVKNPNEFNWLMICKSLGTKCGIADYSKSLFLGARDEQNSKLTGGNILIAGESVEYRKVLEENNLHLINLQLEYQFITPRRLKSLMDYLNASKIIPTVTLHTVNPQAADYHKVLLEGRANVIVSSEPMRELLITRCGIPPHRAHVIPMGISSEFVRAPMKRTDTQKFRIGFFGFCYFHKGIDKLIRYMSSKHAADKECLVLSTKPENDSGYCEKMQNFMRTCGNIPMSWVLDYLEEKQIVDSLSTCDLIFLPYSEYGGYATSAAIRTCLKAGVPIVAFDTNFFRDVVHDRKLVHFIGKDPLNFEEWSENLSAYIEISGRNELLKAEYVKNRDKFVEDFSWKNTGKMHLEYFYNLIKQD